MHVSKIKPTEAPESVHLVLFDNCVFVCFQLHSECRHVRHYWFTSWPDHHIPQCIAPYLRLVEEVETYSKSLMPPSSSQEVSAPASSPGPIIIHCRSVLVFLQKNCDFSKWIKLVLVSSRYLTKHRQVLYLTQLKRHFARFILLTALREINKLAK